ncbi:MAG: hypothetical protein V2I33_21165, partial [Kangiellaceae bacterium]|nr:hypothetical protein [Kangiellaceae bacterium]
ELGRRPLYSAAGEFEREDRRSGDRYRPRVRVGEADGRGSSPGSLCVCSRNDVFDETSRCGDVRAV